MASRPRAGNVIGGGDWAPDRIVPDCVRALTAGEPIVVRNPDAVRPWQHVLEPLSGYLLPRGAAARRGRQLRGAWNFGPADTAATAGPLGGRALPRRVGQRLLGTPPDAAPSRTRRTT